MSRNSRKRNRAGTGTCYICTLPGADSSDHVIARGFFPEGTRPDLPKLPAHASCHGGQSGISDSEEYLRNILAALADNNTTAAAGTLPQRAINKAFNNNRKLREQVQQSLTTLKPADINHPGYYQFAVDQSRFAAALNKIVRGLYVHSTGKILPVDGEFRWAPWGAPLDDTMARVFDSSKVVVSYPRTFEARYFKGADQSAWFLRFYDSRPFCGIVNG